MGCFVHLLSYDLIVYKTTWSTYTSMNDVLHACDIVLVAILSCSEWMTYCTPVMLFVNILVCYEWMTYCSPVMLCWSIFRSAMSEWRSALLWCCVCQYVDLLWVNDIVHSCDVVLKIIEIIFVEIPFPNANSCSEIRKICFDLRFTYLCFRCFSIWSVAVF